MCLIIKVMLIVVIDIEKNVESRIHSVVVFYASHNEIRLFLCQILYSLNGTKLSYNFYINHHAFDPISTPCPLPNFGG